MWREESEKKPKPHFAPPKKKSSLLGRRELSDLFSTENTDRAFRMNGSLFAIFYLSRLWLIRSASQASSKSFLTRQPILLNSVASAGSVQVQGNDVIFCANNSAKNVLDIALPHRCVTHILHSTVYTLRMSIPHCYSTGIFKAKTVSLQT